jgi:serine/threonine-protein kinase
MDDDAELPHLRRARARVGQSVKGKWRLERLLGVGGMAAVYAAVHRNGKRVALKWLHTELTLDRGVRERFLREGYIANKVAHPGVVSVLDDDVAEDGALVLVMELLEGETIEARRRRLGGTLPPAEILFVAHEVTDVLAAAHAVGAVHRDLKPENLFLARDGSVKVLDFGIARMRDLSMTGGTNANSSLGTPGFMPPEQARGRWEEVDGRADLWALGATMFTLATGRHVHEATTVNEQLLAAMTMRAAPLTSVAQRAPGALARVVDRALAPDKKDRWADAREMQLAAREAYREVSGVPMANAPRLVPEEQRGDIEEMGPISETLMASDTPSIARVRSAPPTPTPTRARRRARWRSAIVMTLGAAIFAPAAFLAARRARPMPPVGADAAMTASILSVTSAPVVAPLPPPPVTAAAPTATEGTASPVATVTPTARGGKRGSRPTAPPSASASAPVAVPPPASAQAPAPTAVPTASASEDPLDRRR